MKVTLVNKFFYKKGGAETYFFEIATLLQKYGHNVEFFSMKHPDNYETIFKKYFVSQVDYETRGFKNIIKSSLRMLYSLEAQKKMKQLMARRPDIVHLNNIYHQISPSILRTINNHGVASVMTLHDLKMVCGSYAMVADEKICEACKDGKHYNCFLKSCMKNSILKSLLTSIEMYLHHRILKIYNQVDIFISPSQFIMNKLTDMGFRGRIIYLANFVECKNFLPIYQSNERSIAYIGRLSRDKGLMTLVEAVKNIKNVTLKIIGTGPLKDELMRRVQAEHIKHVSLFGFKSGRELQDEIGKSMFVIVPSELYENSPMTVLESFAMGKPVIGSRIGGIPELIKDNVTGLTFEAGNKDDLCAKIQMLADDPESVTAMGQTARRLVEKEFSADNYYQKLIAIYNEAITKRKKLY